MYVSEKCQLEGGFSGQSARGGRRPVWAVLLNSVSAVLVCSGCVCAKLLQSCPALCDSWTIARQAPLSMGTLQAKILEWVAMPFSGGIPKPGREPSSLTSPALASCHCLQIFKDIWRMFLFPYRGETETRSSEQQLEGDGAEDLRKGMRIGRGVSRLLQAPGHEFPGSHPPGSLESHLSKWALG